LPATVKKIAVLDRTKEPGAAGEPLYKDVVTALCEAAMDDTLPMGSLPRVVGGRYGLSSKEFTPAMVKGIFDELTKPEPKKQFTIGINDDVSCTSLDYDPTYIIGHSSVFQGIFFGLGSDGTVSANKNSIKIIGEETDNHTQGYFVYDSKKAGSQTISHLRFGPDAINWPYLIQKAGFVACHQFDFITKTDILKRIVDGGTFLLNSPYGPDEVWDHLPDRMQHQIISKNLNFYCIDATKVAKEAGMGGRINTVLQTCFFAIAEILPRDEAIDKIKQATRKSFGHKGEDVVQKNFAAVDQSLANLHKIEIPDEVTGAPLPPIVPENAPGYMKDVVAKMIIGEGDTLPVSALPNDGTFPVGTAAWEKRNLAEFVPEWIEEICAQCGNCALVCPHSVIRMKAFDKEHLATAPAAFKTVPLKGREAVTDQVFTLQISVEDCTGCTLCVKACPVEVPDEPGRKCINMVEKAPLLERDKVNWEFFKELPEYDRTAVEADQVRGVQYMEPLFEFSGACAGCGETPYIRMVTQMFGDRALIANATGCSSIFGGNLPTAPWSKNKEGRGTAWCNSLFEDNAEFGFGFRISVDQLQRQANRMLEELTDEVGPDLARAILDAPQSTEAEIIVQRKRVGRLKEILSGMNGAKNGAAAKLLPIADYLIERSIWLIGGDGWAYDIGFGGLDHVLANNRNVNVMVLDTEVYSNTGGQQSKATPRAAVAKFATSGKALGKKDLGMIAMCYGHVYVAQVAFGADAKQTARAIAEAEAHDGPSLIIAYSPCIEHGVDLEENIGHQALAVTSGYWPLYRFDPKLADYGESAMRLDSEKTIPFMDYAITENRFSMLMRTNPDEAEKLIKLAQSDIDQRWHIYQQWAQMGVDQADLAPPMAIV
ncbi:MAG: pyruvate:ferredoxin (flavodoxin) oxidoreductase, partial [Myxococcota bacterium]